MNPKVVGVVLGIVVVIMVACILLVMFQAGIIEFR